MDRGGWQATVQFSSVHVRLFATPWIAAHQASLSITNSWSLFKPMPIESVMPSNYLILCRPLLLPSSFPASGSFSMSWVFASGGQSIGASASTSVLPMNIQSWLALFKYCIFNNFNRRIITLQYCIDWTSLVAQLVKNLLAMQENWVPFPSQEEPLEKEMATSSSILAWRIPWIEEPDRLQSMGSQESDTT